MRKQAWMAVLGLAFAGAGARSAMAQTMCNDASIPNPIYVTGSSAIEPFIKAMAVPLAAATTPTTIIYQKPGSCIGPATIIADTTPNGACQTGGCMTGVGLYLDATGAAKTCNLVAGTHADVGVSDVLASSCPGGTATLPATVKAFTGPVQAMAYVVPKDSQATALTAEEGYFVFGFGMAGMVTPWINNALIIVRDQNSGTQQMTARAVGIQNAAQLNKFGTGSTTGTQGVIDGLVAAGAGGNANAAIGIMGAADYDKNRTTLHSLAFQTFKQKYAYYPDSTATSFDKKNVRDGHYVVWGYLNLFAAYDTTAGALARPNAKKFIDWVTLNTAGTAFPAGASGDMLDITIASKTIPQCAMRVSHTVEVGDLSLYSPPEPCGCYFDSKVATTSCTACTGTGAGTCTGAGQQCRRGFCEAR